MKEIKSELGYSGPEENMISNLSELPWPREAVINQYNTYIVYKDGYPVTEGHLLLSVYLRRIRRV